MKIQVTKDIEINKDGDLVFIYEDFYGDSVMVSIKDVPKLIEGLQKILIENQE